MKYLSISVCSFALFVLLGCAEQTSQKQEDNQEENKAKVEVMEVAAIKGQQLTGVTLSNERLFVNFPRWRKKVTWSVAEVTGKDKFTPYPNQQWNDWEIGEPVNDSVFVAVQSVVASDDGLLYVIDTRNPEFKGVVGVPLIFVFDLKKNTLVKTYQIDKKAFGANSYVNDIRIDNQRGYAYMTDSGQAGLIVLNLKTGESKRVLDRHVSTTSEASFLTINGKKWKNTVHSDGIALDPKKGTLYYHALTGYSLYAVSVDSLINASAQGIEKSVRKVKKTAAPDGMIIYEGSLYYADLEQHKIMQMNLSTLAVKVLAEGTNIKWADSFGVANGYLYFTNSRIHEAQGDISALNFTVNKVKLP